MYERVNDVVRNLYLFKTAKESASAKKKEKKAYITRLWRILEGK